MATSSNFCKLAPLTPWVVTLGCLVLWTGCSRKATSDREIWAEVDGKPIFRDQVERYYRSRMTSASEAGKEEQAVSFKLNILNELIDEQILLAHASHSRITVSEAEVDKKVAELRSPYSEEEFQKKLSDQGLTLGELREEVRQNLIIDKLLNKEIASRVVVTDAEVADYYAHNKANFNVPETEYHLAQILVTPTPDPQVRNLMNDDAKDRVAAERKIQALHARLRAGEDFAKLAQAYSEDPRTAPGGGDMGFIPVSSLAADGKLKQALSSLQVGQISGIIRDAGGYHIIKILGRENAGQRDLSDPQVRNNIRQSLMNQKGQLLKAAHIEGLRNRAKVVDYLAQHIVRGGGNPYH